MKLLFLVPRLALWLFLFSLSLSLAFFFILPCFLFLFLLVSFVRSLPPFLFFLFFSCVLLCLLFGRIGFGFSYKKFEFGFFFIFFFFIQKLKNEKQALWLLEFSNGDNLYLTRFVEYGGWRIWRTTSNRNCLILNRNKLEMLM